MKKTVIISMSIAILTLVTMPFVFSDSDHYWGKYRQKSIGVNTVKSKLYTEECGSCHMAYQPGLLISQSWIKIMSDLEQHFGDNAELDKETSLIIKNYLLSNSAEKSDYRRSRKFSRQINKNNPPDRITDTAYFIKKHDEIPVKMVTSNNKVNSFSHCNACHTQAEKGLYDEHGVTIPGYGRWED